jgi:hypothetical protein
LAALSPHAPPYAPTTHPSVGSTLLDAANYTSIAAAPFGAPVTAATAPGVTTADVTAAAAPEVVTSSPPLHGLSLLPLLRSLPSGGGYRKQLHNHLICEVTRVRVRVRVKVRHTTVAAPLQCNRPPYGVTALIF